MALTMDELLSVPVALGPDYGPELRRRGANVPFATLIAGETRMRGFRDLPLRNDEVLSRIAGVQAAYRTGNDVLIRRAQAALSDAQAREWLRGTQDKALSQERRGIFVTSGALEGMGWCCPIAGLG